MNVKRVWRIWRREGLKVPKKQPKRGRLCLNDGSCVRLRPERPNHVCSYDFVQDSTEDGRTFRMPCVIDEFTRRCLAILVARRLRSDDVLQRLTDLFVERGPPEHIRSANELARAGALSLTDWHRDWGQTTFTFRALAKAETRPLPFFAKGAWSKSDAAH